ncbi:MAG: VWA domain-containing protein [Anaerolineae bacterium]|nr:VWA domain-containing protein [Phycisphaerae bacterium]
MRSHRFRVSSLIIAASLIFGFARSASAAGLLVADNGFGGQLQIKEQSVHVTVNNGVAVTTVTQVFQNMEDRQVEALYTFPVPRGASVSNFSMWINGKEMIGEVLEKKHAREIYESYKQTKRDPGLLEQTDYRTFEMRVFPIAPRAEQKVQIAYYQELDFDHDWATYVYPLATSTRTGRAAESAAGKFAINIDIKSEIPITAVESPSHGKDFAVAKQNDSYYQASLEARGGSLNKDVVMAFHVARPRTGIDVIASKPGKEDGYFALTLTAGEELPQINKAMDYVFVLDISGSMNDDGKLDLSQKSLGTFIAGLSPEDRFEVMTFNVQPTTCFGKLMPADEPSRTKANEFLSTQQARGGTVLNPAVSTAYKYADKDRPLVVIILSDGMTEQSERTQLIKLIGQRPAGARVFCIGVGNDVNRGLLEQLANDSGGLAAFLSREDNLQRQAAAFRRKLLRPIATDLKIDVEGGSVVQIYDVEPKQLPNLYHGAPIRLYGRYKGDGPVVVKLHGNVLGKELTQSLPIDLPRQDESNPEIERMWAWHRVDRLQKEADANGSRTSVIDEIVRLGEGYSIATEYTSFIVLENDAEFQRWKIDRKNALRIERDRKAQTQLAARLEKMREKATAALGPADAKAIAADAVKDLAAPAKNMSQPNAASPNNTPTRSSPRSRDINLPGGGGGGAIDPISGAMLIGLSVLAFRATRGRKGARS